jgi:hypothetical protein
VITSNLGHRQRALESFAYWLGSRSILELERLPESAEKILIKIVSALYYPPSAHAAGRTSGSLNPRVDTQYFEELATILGILPNRNRWPEGKPFALILTSDVDRIWSGYAELARAFRSRSFFPLVKNISRGTFGKSYRNFMGLCESLQRWNIPATIFLLQERRRLSAIAMGQLQHVLNIYQLDEIQEEVRALMSEEVELGLHMSFDSYHSVSSLRVEREKLEKIWDTKIFGSRAHYLMFDDITPENLFIEEFVYDSTMGFNFNLGFRCATSFPFLLKKKGSRELWEIPFSLMDTTLIWLAAEQGWKAVSQHVEEVFNHIKETGGVLVINWHQERFNKVAQPELFEVLGQIIERSIAAGAYTPTLNNLIKWWQGRTERT